MSRHHTAVSPRPLRPRPVFAALASVAVGARVVVGDDPPCVGLVEGVRPWGDAVVRCSESRVVEVPVHFLRSVGEGV